MGKFSFFMALIAIGACFTLFKLPYVGVTLAGILLSVVVTSSLLSYLTRPKEVKQLEKEVSSIIKEGVGIAKELTNSGTQVLQEINQE